MSIHNNEQANAIDGYLQQKFHWTETADENYSDADCLFVEALQQLSDVPPSYTGNDLRWQLIQYIFHNCLKVYVSNTENSISFWSFNCKLFI